MVGIHLKTLIFERSELDHLVETLKRRDYKVIGPLLRGGAIVYDEITNTSSLPIGWTDERSNGKYRLKNRDDAVVFDWTVGPQSWKRFLFPPIQKIFATHKRPKGIDLPNTKKQPVQETVPAKYAFLGVRPCDLHAIAVQDKVFLGGPYRDPVYERKRSGNFIIAVNCRQAGGTCFCASMGTGPKATSGFDIALTEVLEGKRHYFIVEVGTELGGEVLKSLKCLKATDENLAALKEICEKTTQQMGRSLDTTNLKSILYQNSEHPRWESTASRCLTCANCTMVCPTCFCATIEDVTDLSGKQAERMRKWDSCFTLDFSYIHGGSVRASTKARYRQWVTHKLASWVDQFGTLGCVGCGRCITWCPVGIDITEEVRTIRENQS
ncbi:MAG: sulfite reductase subunit A [Ignavibacteriae bacterium]|nr:MAG: sulfite reductase subunit A [Ignavibacteriota bacterium]